ncbi:MAG: TonB-dependent receptor [Bacteroidales bacterium]|nr:TonB-dependent receptor [Bacteroidales bacterium]MBN2820386.1 TonB-dependent receptor [Bacteroidales bacterium]
MKKKLIVKVSTTLLLILFTSILGLCQDLNINGRVTDESGVPLPGVSIYIEGTTLGTITDDDGDYSISAPTNSVLVYTYLGFLTDKIIVTDQSEINISLVPDIASIDQIVVVGYGVQRKEAITGSVASIKGDELREIPSTNFTQAIQGRMPGVQISQTSTKPGESMQIRIRGTRSLTASNDPLIVLDGIPFAGNISDINPNDINSIDILKDASATAIYGSRGANGVILITTKKGRQGEKAKFDYNGYTGFKKAIPYPMMDGPSFVALREARGQYVNNDLDESNDVNTDWQELMYRTGIVTSHDMAVSGGTKQGNYNFGVGYYLDQAVIPTSQYSRISLRASLDQGIGEYLRFGFSSNNNSSLTEGSQVGLYSTLSMSPIADPYEADGSYKRVIHMPSDDYWSISRDIVNDNAEIWLREKRGYGSYNNLYAEVIMPGIKGLKYRINSGLNLRIYNEGSFTGKGIGNVNPETPSTAGITNSQRINWVVENLLMYDRTFNEKHQINLVALYSAEQDKYNSSNVSAKDIPNEIFRYYNLGAANGEIIVNPDYQRYEMSELLSWMGRAMYSYDNRYMFTATLRSDGSSRLAEGHKWHTYPAVSVGWNIGREAFMEGVTPVNSLKLRAGYGQTSNQAVSPYATLGLLNSEPYNHGDDMYVNGFYVSKLPNTNLGWEYSETMNFGIDYSLLDYRFYGTMEYYVTNTKDILLNVSMPRTSGVESYTGNIGETHNKGIEFSLNASILNNPDGLTWDLGVNVYSNKNKLVALASGEEEDIANWWFVGHPINVVYDHIYDGLWQEGDPYLEILEPGGNPEEKIGMIKVKYYGDYNEDGSPTRAISDEDKQVISLDPDFMGGFNTRLAYKSFDLNIVGTFQKGGVLISQLHSSNGWLNLLSGRRNNVDVDYWTPTNTGAKYPNPAGPKSSENPLYGSTLGYFDATYLKVRTISIGYNVNQKWSQKAGIQKARIYATVQNPLVLFSPFHKESGLDPETNSYGNENAAVAYSYQRRRILTVGTNTPQTHNYLFGLNITF